MSTKKYYLFVLLFAFAVGAGFFASSLKVMAADPTFLVSWKAEDYAPINYLGKTLPVNQTKIDVSFELVGTNPSDNGKIIDLSGNEVRWYVNSHLMSQSNGTKTFSFITNDDNDASTAVKISVEYSDPTAGYNYFVDKYIDIPLTHPDIVVAYKNIGSSLSKGGGNIFSAFPYFFNGSYNNLKASWSVNDRVVDSGSDQWNLTVTLGSDYPSGSDIKISVSAQDILNAANIISRTFHFNSK
jgi:hypothetical protein